MPNSSQMHFPKAGSEGDSPCSDLRNFLLYSWHQDVSSQHLQHSVICTWPAFQLHARKRPAEQTPPCSAHSPEQSTSPLKLCLSAEILDFLQLPSPAGGGRLTMRLTEFPHQGLSLTSSFPWTWRHPAHQFAWARVYKICTSEVSRLRRLPLSTPAFLHSLHSFLVVLKWP